MYGTNPPSTNGAPINPIGSVRHNSPDTSSKKAKTPSESCACEVLVDNSKLQC